jgi:predicted  nucleic acid-binding Zn-ribbon protein
MPSKAQEDLQAAYDLLLKEKVDMEDQLKRALDRVKDLEAELRKSRRALARFGVGAPNK